MSCEDIQLYVDSFVDGEFAAPERVEFETHLVGCAACRRLVQEQAGLKSSLRALLRAPAAPRPLRERLEAALEKADAEAPPRAPGVGAPLWARLRGLAVPIVAVCLPLLMLIGQRVHRGDAPFIEDSIVKHQRNLPLEITGGREAVLPWFDGKVPFAVRAPQLEPAASLRGGRLVSLGNREAAYLSYERGGRKISVFVFDPGDLRPGLGMATPRREIIGTHEIYLEAAHGYNVAVFRDRGLGYAITGTLDEPEMLRLISVAVGGP